MNDISACAPGSQQDRDHLGWILEVGVDADNRITARGVVAGGERCLVAEIARQVQLPHPRVLRCERVQRATGAVRRPVIEEHELVVLLDERRSNATVELLEGLDLVVKRCDDRDEPGAPGRGRGSSEGFE